MTERPKYSVVVPVYNSERTLPELARRLGAAVAPLGPYEIVFVDDGSRDGSWAELEKIHASNPRVRIVRLARNFGQHNALVCGFKRAKGEFVVTIDDDLQNPPEEIPRLASEIASDAACDAVFGRPVEPKHDALRNLFSRLANETANYVFGLPREMRLSSFRIVRARVIAEIVRMRSPHPVVSQMILRVTNRVKQIDVRHDARKDGRSGYSYAKLISFAFDVLLSHSALPLKLVSALGFACASASVLGILWYACRFFFVGTGVSGFTTLVLVNLFFPGMILFSFGIVGQYLIRIMQEVNHTPPYSVRAEKGFDR